MDSDVIKRDVIEIGVHDNDCFCSHSYTVKIPVDVYEHRYINEYRFEFIKWGGDLYVTNPMMLAFEFEKVRSNEQIEKAFNPDKYRFEKWLDTW